MLDDITAEALLAGEPARRIVMLFADVRTQAALEEWAAAQGFDLSRSHGGRKLQAGEFEFHCTLFATENEIGLPVGEWEMDPVTLHCSGFAALGMDADTPVLVVEAGSDLVEDRDNLIEESGAEPTFADWLPHVSLSYAWSGEPDLAAIEPPDFPLTFDTVVVGELATKGAGPMYRMTLGQAARKGRKPAQHRSISSVLSSALAHLPSASDIGSMALGDIISWLWDQEAYYRERITLLETELADARTNLATIEDAKRTAEAEQSAGY